MQITVDDIEFNAILAGLRMVQQAITRRDRIASPDDDILTNGGAAEPITADAIDDLCQRINRIEG